MIKRIIFDIDNTILITKEDIPMCLFIGLIEAKIKPTIKLMKQIGYGMQEYEDNYPKYDKKEYIDYFNKKYNYKFDYSLYDYLNNSFAKYSLSKPNKHVIKILKYLNNKYFKNIYGGDIVLKPNKESYILSCGNKKMEECLFIGDNLENDYLGPIKFGLKAILYDKKDVYKDSDYNRIKDFKELEKIL